MQVTNYGNEATSKKEINRLELFEHAVFQSFRDNMISMLHREAQIDTSLLRIVLSQTSEIKLTLVQKTDRKK